MTPGGGAAPWDVLARAGLGLLLAAVAALAVGRLLRRRAEAARGGDEPGRAPSEAAGPAPCAAEGTAPPPPGSRCAEILAFFGDIRPGEQLARWTLRAIGAERQGGIPVVLAGADGASFQVEIRRRDPSGPRAPAEGGELAVYLRGVPDGAATPEELGLGAMTLLDALLELGTAPPAWLEPYRGRGGSK